MNEKYYTDYPTEPIGGDNPYYRCVHCKRSDPEINGRLEKHSPDCAYRLEKAIPPESMEVCEGSAGESDSYSHEMDATPGKSLEEVYTQEYYVGYGVEGSYWHQHTAHQKALQAVADLALFQAKHNAKYWQEVSHEAGCEAINLKSEIARLKATLEEKELDLEIFQARFTAHQEEVAALKATIEHINLDHADAMAQLHATIAKLEAELEDYPKL